MTLPDHGSVALRRLLAFLPECVLGTHAQHGDATAVVLPGRIVDVMKLLRDDRYASMNVLVDLCAVDHLGRRDEPRDARFEVVYHLLALERSERLRVKAPLGAEAPHIASLCELWPAANWMEREVWDLYGIVFDGHPDPRRLLLYEEFQGHPLRKDYPKRGRQPLVGPRN